MTLAARLDDMIVLYTLDGLSLRAIADRMGCTHEAVRLMLLGAGVELRSRSNEGRQPPKPEPGRSTPLPTRPPEPVRTLEEHDLLADSHYAHLRAIRAALGGKGFPFFTFRSAA